MAAVGAVANPDRKVLVAWLIAVGILTARELKSGAIMPRPSVYVGSAIVYGGAAIIAEFSGDLAVALAAGWTIAIGLALVGKPTGPAPSQSKIRSTTQGVKTK